MYSNWILMSQKLAKVTIMLVALAGFSCIWMLTVITVLSWDLFGPRDGGSLPESAQKPIDARTRLDHADGILQGIAQALLACDCLRIVAEFMLIVHGQASQGIPNLNSSIIQASQCIIHMPEVKPVLCSVEMKSTAKA